MQTFLPYPDVVESAKVLDRQRLGKQRVEAIQIARELLGITKTNCSNHPAVKMWRGFEPFLIRVYLKAILDEWESRGYKNTKSIVHYYKLKEIVKDRVITKPFWLDDMFCQTHRSNLVAKKPDYYSQFFNEKGGMEYEWPI